ncbi:MAG: sensor domain-containing protein [Catenulispora sp.]|nr:sensor domain-containing protein [Catenulispora sp.]
MAGKSSANQPTQQLGVLQPGGTPPPPEPAGRRRPLLIALAVIVVLAIAGSVTWALWPRHKAPPIANAGHVVPGTLQAAVLTPDEASGILGTTVITGPVIGQPPPALTADPKSCEVAVGPATVSGYTPGWTVFLSTTYQDAAGTGAYSVTQTVGAYGSADQASGVFGKLGDGVKGCQSATRTDGNSSVKWNYTVDTASADTLVWKAEQDSGGGWACFRQARLKGKDVVQVAICEAGDGKAATARIADQLTSRLGG